MKVAVGISGGVDSTVAALLLKEAGHDVVGVTMTLGRANEDANLQEARTAAATLEIPLHVINLAEAWHRDVLAFSVDTYRRGQTPNPCVRCNELVKFNLLPRWAFETLGCDAFATGHYARLDHGRLLRAVDHAKDQSYFLYRVPKDVLTRTLFPLGSMTKPEVRSLAKSFGLSLADHADSQDFCGLDPRHLIPGDRPPISGDRPQQQNGDCPQRCDEITAKDRNFGEIRTVEGRIIGQHDGYWHFTVGQRKGLGIGGGIPFYVVSIDSARNLVIVGTKEQSLSYSFALTDVIQLKYASAAAGTDPIPVGTDPRLRVKVRSAGEPYGPVTFDGKTCRCPNGIAGVAPGQSAVFYCGEEVVGGGIIT